MTMQIVPNEEPKIATAELEARWEAISSYYFCSAKRLDETPAELEDVMELAVDDLVNARGALLRMEAPHLKALRCKLEVIFEEDGSESIPAWSRDVLAETLRDIGRLIPSEQSVNN